MHRTDRKYIAPLDTVRALVADLSDTHRVLQIKDRLYTTYRTLYFDTLDFEAARSHVQQSPAPLEDPQPSLRRGPACAASRSRPRTTAARPTRSWASATPTATALLDRRGAPTSSRSTSRSHPELRRRRPRPGRRGLLHAGHAVRSLRRHPRDDRLEPALPPRVRRRLAGRPLRAVETKGPSTPRSGRPFPQQLGIRPRSFSKYVAAASTLNTNIADNDFRISRDVCSTTGRAASDAWTPPHGPGRPAMSSSRSSRSLAMLVGLHRRNTCRPPSMSPRPAPPPKPTPTPSSKLTAAAGSAATTDPAPPLLDAGDIRTVATLSSMPRRTRRPS